MSFGRAIADAVVFSAVALIGGAFAAGGLAVWLLPKLWHWLKPIIHQVTG